MKRSIDPGHRRRTALAGAVLGLLAAGAPARSTAGDGPGRLPSFSSAVDMVKLNVSVTDLKGFCVTGLGAGDFAILEDGVAQRLSLFTRERLPISLAVLIDSSLSMEDSLPAVKTAALRLLRALHASDQAEVVEFNQHFAVRQDFTSDQALLEAALQGIRAGGNTGLYNALYLTLKDPRFRPRPDALIRQAVVVLTDGEDTSSLVDDDQILELARKSDVTVFTISLSRPPRRPVPLTEPPSRATFFLNALARETGGRSYYPTGLAQLDGVYDKIAEDLRTQYALGYVSSNPARDGRYRRLAIQVAQDNVLLRHRQGYHAGAGRALARPRD
jgi:Ca-activated chloride channel homolog